MAVAGRLQAKCNTTGQGAALLCMDGRLDCGLWMCQGQEAESSKRLVRLSLRNLINAHSSHVAEVRQLPT